ncbi:MAG: nitrilase-related carbon-nitrogen hydrolase [bacterium]
MEQDQKIKIALAQFAATEDLEANLVKGESMAGEAARAGASFCGFTELAFRRFFPQHRADAQYFEWAETLDGPTVTRFLSIAKEAGIDCAANFFERAGGGRFYDTTVICRSNGQVLGPVRMMHTAEEPGYNEKYYYWAGDTPPLVFDLGYAKIGVAICYDRHFPEYTRALVLQGADIIFSPFAGLVEDPLDMYEIEMQGLAFQSQVFVACVNRVGQEEISTFAGSSFVVAPDGHVLRRAPRDKEHLLVADLDISEIEKCRIKRPFLRDRRSRFYREFLQEKSLVK